MKIPTIQCCEMHYPSFIHPFLVQCLTYSIIVIIINNYYLLKYLYLFKPQLKYLCLLRAFPNPMLTSTSRSKLIFPFLCLHNNWIAALA